MKGSRCLSFCLNKSALSISNLTNQRSQQRLLDFMGPRSSITHLSLNSTVEVIHGFNFFPALIAKLPGLVIFELDNVRKKIDPALLSETLSALLKVNLALPYEPDLQQISLRNLKIIKEASITISELVPALPALTTFEVVNCEYENDECYTIISSGIVKSRSLRSLTWTRITTKDIRALSAITESISNCKSLEKLTFEYTRGPEKEFMKRLCAMLRGLSATWLKLQLTTIPPESVRDFADVLAANKLLTTFIFSIKSLAEENCKDVLLALRGNGRIRKLHILSESMCTEACFSELAATLRSCRGVEQLKFVLLGDYQTIGRIGEYIATAEALRTVNVKVGEHFGTGAEAINTLPILDGLARNGRLQKVSLPLIPLGEDLPAKLQAFIESSKQLRKLKLLPQDRIPAAVELAIGVALQKATSVDTFIYRTASICQTLHNLRLDRVGHLTRIKLDGHGSQKFPKPEDFTSIIQGNPGLRSLKLLQCNISNTSAIAIAKTIETHPSLESVNLHWILCDMSGILRLTEALKRNPRIRGLNVENSKVEAQLFNFVDVWKRDRTTLPVNKHTVSFEWIMLLLAIMSSNVKAQAKAQRKWSAFCNAYKYCVNGVGTVRLPDEKELKEITKVDLSNTTLEATKGAKVAKLLSSCQNLDRIAMVGVRLRIRGAVAVSRMIAKLPRLAHLDISFNRISSSGMHWISQALRTNKSIKTLSVKGNFIYTHGAAELLEAIEANPESKLETLDMGSCKIEYYIGNTFKRLRGLGHKLKSLSMIVNPINSGFVKRLIEIYVAEKWHMRISLSLRSSDEICRQVVEAGLKDLIRFIK